MFKKILGVKIYNYTFNHVVDLVDGAMKTDNYRYIATVNSEFVNEATRNSDFKKAINNAWISVCDAVGVKWAMMYLHGIKIERIPGVDLTWALLKLAEDRGYTVFLLGGEPDTICETVAKNIKVVHPNIKIVGSCALGPKDPETINEVNRLKPDILFVAYGSPKQEIFLHQNRKKFDVKVAVGVGGTFDFISGNVKRAPIWMRKIGLEWLYRLIRQPSRIIRIFNATVMFPIKVICSKLKQ